MHVIRSEIKAISGLVQSSWLRHVVGEALPYKMETLSCIWYQSDFKFLLNRNLILFCVPGINKTRKFLVRKVFVINKKLKSEPWIKLNWTEIWIAMNFLTINPSKKPIAVTRHLIGGTFLQPIRTLGQTASATASCSPAYSGPFSLGEV